MECPESGCSFESSEHGVRVHSGRVHSVNKEECENCGDIFERPSSKVRDGQNSFCSTMCSNEYRTGKNNPNGTNSVTITCAACGYEKEKPASVANRGQVKHFCNENCMVKYWREQHVQSGEDNPMYGGKGSDWRSRSEWLNLRQEKLEQQSECEWCGDDSNIHIHHSIPVFAGGEKYSLDNLSTLCESCHYKVHGRIDILFKRGVLNA